MPTLSASSRATPIVSQAAYNVGRTVGKFAFRNPYASAAAVVSYALGKDIKYIKSQGKRAYSYFKAGTVTTPGSIEKRKKQAEQRHHRRKRTYFDSFDQAPLPKPFHYPKSKRTTRRSYRSRHWKPKRYSWKFYKRW